MSFPRPEVPSNICLSDGEEIQMQEDCYGTVQSHLTGLIFAPSLIAVFLLQINSSCIDLTQFFSSIDATKHISRPWRTKWLIPIQRSFNRSPHKTGPSKNILFVGAFEALFPPYWPAAQEYSHGSLD